MTLDDPAAFERRSPTSTYLTQEDGLTFRAVQTKTLLEQAVPDMPFAMRRDDEGEGQFIARLQLIAIYQMLFGKTLEDDTPAMLALFMSDAKMLDLQRLLSAGPPGSDVEQSARFGIALEEWLQSVIDEVDSHPSFQALSVAAQDRVNYAIAQQLPRAAARGWTVEAIRNYEHLVGINSELRAQVSALEAQQHSEGVEELKADFSTFASREGWKATGLAALVLAALVALFILGVNVLGGLNELTVALAITKASLSIPAFAAIYFLGSLSLRFRKSAEWARAAAVQLETIDRFVLGMEPGQRQQMLMTLGARVYGTSSLGGDDGSNDTLGANHAADVVKAVTELVEKIRG